MNQDADKIESTEDQKTYIYKSSDYGEERVGYIGADNLIYKLRWETGIAIGRIEQRDGLIRIFRNTIHDEKELGTVDQHATIHSHGVFEGGELGWMDPDNVVVQGGLILGEEEVGRVEGPQALAAAAALLLLFLPEDAEANRQMTRGT
jgi:hypothetical protein